MTKPSKYNVAMSTLDRVRVPVEQQSTTQGVHVDREYVSPEDLDRARLLSPLGAGTLRAR